MATVLEQPAYILYAGTEPISELANIMLYFLAKEKFHGNVRLVKF